MEFFAEKEEIAVEKLREITIELDTYDDIFSDFDPRPYSQRALSEDFLKEMQRRYMEDKKGRFEVIFTIPPTERSADAEALIKKRLREHFDFMVKEKEKEIGKIKQRGYLYIVVGALVLLADTIFFFALHEENIFYRILSILLIPAGWYGMFTGIGKVVDEPFEAVEKKKFYEKFGKANFIFLSEEME